MFAFAVLSLKPHPKSLSRGEGLSAPFSSGEGLGMRPKFDRNTEFLNMTK